MKHPALTRVLAIVLAILCLTMGMAGWLGLRRAERDRQSALDEAERLRGRVEEYQTLLTRLEGNKSYNKQTEKIDNKQAAHDKDSAEHRTELSTYTLTQYGLKMGTDALDMADEQFAYYKAMAEEALAKFDGGIAQISELLGYLWEMDDRSRRRMLEYCGYTDGDWTQGCPAIVRTMFESAAGLLILPIQDLLGYGSDTRLNIPGKADGNWQYRVTKEQIDSIDRARFRRLNELYKR